MPFNKFPTIRIDSEAEACIRGWSAISERINEHLKVISSEKKIVVIECYQGVYYEELKNWSKTQLHYDQYIHATEAWKTESRIRELTQPNVTDDRIFGYMTRLSMEDFFDPPKQAHLKENLAAQTQGTIVIFGYGASLLAEEPDLLIYADMARWEIQQRMRKNKVNNLGILNLEEATETQYKRAFFVDWRVCDKLKRKLMGRWHYVLDTNTHTCPKLVKGEAMRMALKQAATRPFSLVPFFDPGPWGGQWMKEVCELDKKENNYAWCFNCVPEENSLLFDFNGCIVEIPSINLVFYQPEELLGEAVYGRFGDEFPIRFDYLDTIDGGNLSLQVHPLTEYIQEKFGIHYTQDESYYLLDARPGAKVYLGLKEGVNKDDMIRELQEAQNNGTHFEDARYVQQWEVKKHDHVLIPAGTVHCSGAGSMVLEISSTPYIFTFKLWDWGRVGLDGNPRPINIEHGKNVIQWDRTTGWTERNLINRVEKIAEGKGWIEERTGLHEKEFIETRRHWFRTKTNHHTRGGVHVLNLIEGEEAVVESPSGAFSPFVIHYAETFVVPAQVGPYTIRPHGKSTGKQIATIKAFVRTNA